MKKYLKMPFKAAWRLTSFVRRPFARKIEAMIARGCASVNHTHFCHVNEETNLVMDHLVRELVRLQSKIDRLQDTVEDLAPSSNGLGVVGGQEHKSLRSTG